MKFNYRSNKFLEFQKMRGASWSKQISGISSMKKFQRLHPDQSYDWQEKLTQFLSDIHRSRNFKNLHFTPTMVEKSRKWFNINKSIQAFQSMDPDFGCVIFDKQQTTMLYGIYKDYFLGVLILDNGIANVELITFNNTEQGYTYSSFLQSVTESVRGTKPEVASTLEEIKFYIYEELICLLTHYHFATLEKHSIHCKKVRKVVIENEKYINETEIPIQIVHTAPSNKLEHTTSFAVTGHFRLQPCGKERKERKLVWIHEFEKQSSSPAAPQDSL